MKNRDARFVQITASFTAQGDNIVETLFALDASGSVWTLDAMKKVWRKLPSKRAS